MSVTFRAWYWWPDLALSLGRYSACNRASHLKWKKARTSSSALVRVWWSAYMSICSNIILSSRRPDQAPKDQPLNAVFSGWKDPEEYPVTCADRLPMSYPCYRRRPATAAVLPLLPLKTITLAGLITGPKSRAAVSKTDQKMKVWLLSDWCKRSYETTATEGRYATLMMLTQWGRHLYKKPHHPI